MKINLTKQGGVLYPLSQEDHDNLMKLSDAIYSVDLKNMDNRTLAQNRALHLWCKQLAEALNRHGLYMTGVFGNKIEWTMELSKTQIVKATMKAIFDIDSTAKLQKKQIDELVDYITAALATKGLVAPMFPSSELWEK